MAEVRLTFRLVDDWPETDSPTPAVRFDEAVPHELRDRAVLSSLIGDDHDDPVVDIPPTVFRGVEAVPYEVRLSPSLTVIRYRHVIRSTNRRPESD